MILFFKLLIAHLLADFIFQSNALVKDKEEKKIRSLKLYFHVALHGLLSLLFVWDIHFWKYTLMILITHYFIDLAKIYLCKEKYKREGFLIDQLLHITVLAIICLYIHQTPIDVAYFINNQTIILATFLLFLTKPSSIFIKIFISKWTPEETQKIASLESAGNWIGILERILIFVFIAIGKWDAVGFLLAAKSIFRFGDLKEANDRKLTEYILIGTLSSFGLAILTGLFYQLL